MPELIEVPFELVARVGPRHHVLDEGPMSKGKGKFWGESGTPL